MRNFKEFYEVKRSENINNLFNEICFEIESQKINFDEWWKESLPLFEAFQNEEELLVEFLNGLRDRWKRSTLNPFGNSVDKTNIWGSRDPKTDLAARMGQWQNNAQQTAANTATDKAVEPYNNTANKAADDVKDAFTNALKDYITVAQSKGKFAATLANGLLNQLQSTHDTMLNNAITSRINNYRSISTVSPDNFKNAYMGTMA